MSKDKNKTRFKGGLDLYQRKEPAFSREQRQLLSPKHVYIPMEEGTDPRLVSAFLDKSEFEELVKLEYPGVDHTTFGKFKLLTDEKTIHEKFDAYQNEQPILAQKPDYDTIINIAKRSFIIDETDGTPLFRKLEAIRTSGIKVLIANAIDEEPYVSSSINTLMQKGDKVMDALLMIGDALGASSTFAVTYSDIDDTKTSIPAEISGVTVRKISGKYPIKGRTHVKILKLTGGKEYGLIGIQALLHLYRAIYFGKKQNTTIVTVAGDCVNYSCNVEVIVGTTVREILEFVGLSSDPARVIIRGSMSGVSMQGLDVPILHSEKAILAFESDIKTDKLPCINCGNCSAVCPAGLAPQFIYKYNKIGDRETAKSLNVERCIDCGCCSFVCPARLELSFIAGSLKDEVLEERKTNPITKETKDEEKLSKKEKKTSEKEIKDSRPSRKDLKKDIAAKTALKWAEIAELELAKEAKGSKSEENKVDEKKIEDKKIDDNKVDEKKSELENEAPADIDKAKENEEKKEEKSPENIKDKKSEPNKDNETKQNEAIIDSEVDKKEESKKVIDEKEKGDAEENGN